MKKGYLKDRNRRLLFKETEISTLNTKLNMRLKDLNILQSLIQQVNKTTPLNKIKNRCCITDRSKSVYKRFRMSRIVFRELALIFITCLYKYQ